MSKYYLITVGTPYCGEIAYHVLEVAEGEDLHDLKYLTHIDLWIADNAQEWYDDDDYDYDYDDYLADCYWESEEILYAEYLRMIEE